MDKELALEKAKYLLSKIFRERTFLGSEKTCEYDLLTQEISLFLTSFVLRESKRNKYRQMDLLDGLNLKVQNHDNENSDFKSA